MNTNLNIIVIGFIASIVAGTIVRCLFSSGDTCAEDNSLQEKYDMLLRENAELLSNKNIHDASAMFFKKTDNEICWQTNGVFILKDIKFYDVKCRLFRMYDEPTLKTSVPQKTFAPGDAIYLPGPREVTSDAIAVTFVFRNIKYCVIVTKQDSSYYVWKVAGRSIADDEVIMQTSASGMWSDFTFYWNDFYTRNVYIKQFMLSGTEWFSVTRNDCNQCVISFHTN